jgi:hypothetical protein
MTATIAITEAKDQEAMDRVEAQQYAMEISRSFRSLRPLNGAALRSAFMALPPIVAYHVHDRAHDRLEWLRSIRGLSARSLEKAQRWTDTLDEAALDREF